MHFCSLHTRCTNPINFIAKTDLKSVYCVDCSAWECVTVFSIRRCLANRLKKISQLRLKLENSAWKTQLAPKHLPVIAKCNNTRTTLSTHGYRPFALCNFLHSNHQLCLYYRPENARPSHLLIATTIAMN